MRLQNTTLLLIKKSKQKTEGKKGADYAGSTEANPPQVTGLLHV